MTTKFLYSKIPKRCVGDGQGGAHAEKDELPLLKGDYKENNILVGIPGENETWDTYVT